MPSEELRYSVDNPWCVNTILALATITTKVAAQSINIRLAFEVFHNIQESVIDVWLVMELDFDLVKVGEGILEREAVSNRVRSDTSRTYVIQ
jgi:hypothetical protein